MLPTDKLNGSLSGSLIFTIKTTVIVLESNKRFLVYSSVFIYTLYPISTSSSF